MQRGWKTVAVAVIAAATLTSTAFAQRQGRGFGGGFGGGAQLLAIPEVQGELKLTDDQKTKVTSMLEQLRSERQGQFQQLQGLSPEDRQKAMAERTAKEDTQVGAILDADQMKRYHQLVLQREGAQAFMTPTVADKLALTPDQRDKIQGIMRDQQQAMRDARQAAQGDPQAAREKMASLQKDTNDKVMGVLTDTQKAQWKDMLGTPFAFPANAGFGRRNRNNNNNN
jgi:Spy/CpxP family protein refolding chaperone